MLSGVRCPLTTALTNSGVERCQSLPQPVDVLLDAILDRIGAVAHLAEMPITRAPAPG